MTGRDHFDRGNQYLAQHRTGEALEAYQKAALLEPKQPAIPANLGVVLAEMGRIEEARSAYDTAIKLEKNFYPPYELRKAFLQPVILDSRQAATDERSRLTRAVKKFSSQKFLLRQPQDEVGNPGFFLAYQGLNNLEIQTEIASLLLKASPSLRYRADFSRRVARSKIRVGFFSTHFYEHTIGRVNLGLIKHLPRDRFEVFVIKPVGQTDQVTRQIEAAADHMLVVPPILELAREEIERAELDILLFTDIGMEALSYYLAFARLAPVQAALWGHPDTTGIPNVDYYVSTQSFEPENAQSAYSEHLIRLPRHYICLEKDVSEGEPIDKDAFGADQDQKVYFCPQSLFKLHPDTDVLFDRILSQDAKGILCIPNGPEPYWAQRLQRRLAKSCPETHNRIRFIPRITPNEFQRYLSSADAIIDPMHFTGGYTSYLAFSTGSPIVTMPGEFLRGRMTTGLYKQMGMDRFIANSVDEYADIANRLANDPDFRQNGVREITEASHEIFDDHASIKAFANFLTLAFEAAQHGEKLNDSSGTLFV